MWDYICSLDLGSAVSVLFEEVRKHLVQIAIGLVSLFWLVRTARISRANWWKGHFVDEVTFSLIYERQGVIGDTTKRTLVVRDFSDQHADDVWPNEYGVSLIKRLATKVTGDQPFLILPEDSAEQILELVRSSLSGLFPGAFVADAANGNVPMEQFVFGIACKGFGPRGTLRLRIIVVPKKRLEALAKPPAGDETVSMEESSSGWRRKAVEQLWKLWSDPSLRKQAAMEVELPVR